MIYILDVDGTITPSRNVIDPEFKEFFLGFARNNRVWLATGSDKNKTIEQIGMDIWLACERCYQCLGNQLYQKGELIRENTFELTNKLEDFLNNLLKTSQYPHRYGNHIEIRPGTVNFSVVGRDCNQQQRDEYGLWDDEKGERRKFSRLIRKEFEGIDAVVGGQISIDIFNKGQDKGQIAKDLDDIYTFYGDRMQIGGNDLSLMIAAKVYQRRGRSIEVKNWQETFEHLKKIG